MPNGIDADIIIRELIRIAEKDGAISEDEQAILDSIRENIEEYYRILDKNMEDGVITAEEQHELYKARKEMLDDAIEVAKDDDAITADEFNLLKTLRVLIEDIELDEHY